MSETAIRIENLSKRYRIGQRERYYTLRDTLARSLTAPFRRLLQTGDEIQTTAASSVLGPQSSVNGREATIWALKDVSFEVRQGEVVGVIGRNGAGKTTLLKILSRITEPTEGYAEIRGRVGSLLEVGTGFHPELTGRENIYLNGAILGMKRRELDRKFDEIVAFAEVEKFIDTPVKHYSSGMYVRLAFAVAAHLEPEILLVDEVLAVGDAAFQKKCLGKIGEVATEGRTVLFVSHNMGSVHSLTHKCIYLRDGRIAAFNQSRKVIEQYLTESLEQGGSESETLAFYRRNFSADPAVLITEILMRNGSREQPTFVMGSALSISIHMQVFKEIHGANLTIVLKNVQSERVAVLFSLDQGFLLSLKPGRHVVTVRVEGLLLSPGQYFADIGVNRSTQTAAYDVILDFPIFRIVNNGQVTHWLERPWGAVHCNAITWRVME